MKSADRVPIKLARSMHLESLDIQSPVRPACHRISSPSAPAVQLATQYRRTEDPVMSRQHQRQRFDCQRRTAHCVRQWRNVALFSQLLICPRWHEVASDLDERFSDSGGIRLGGRSGGLAEPADWAMTLPVRASDNRPPLFLREACPRQSMASKVRSSILVNRGRCSFGVSARLADTRLYATIPRFEL